MTDREDIEQLTNKLLKASDDYYNGHESMSDHEFDELLAELARKESETGIILSNSPTQHVGTDSIAGEKIQHEYKMLSLPKSKKLTDVQKFALANGRDMWLSWKLDGNSVQCTWDKGRLQKCETRGTGEIGTLITRLQPSIRGIPSVIPYTGKIVVRGEAIIDLSDFNELKELNSEYKNSRNLCAGSLNLKDVNEVKKRRIHWVVYTLVYVDSDDDPNGIQLKTWGERADFMKNTLGLDVVEHEFVPFANIGNAIDRWTKIVPTLNFPVDGIVFARNIHKRLDAKNETGKFYKDQAYAYKFTDECKETYVKDIAWNVNQNCITPVSVFSPAVELAGTKVEKSTLNNIDYCRKLGIGRKAKVRVYKANMIIPQVLDVVEQGDELEIPKTCPVCGAPTKIVESESGSHKLICTNPNCIAKKQKAFERFVSRKGMNIDSIGPSTISDFVNKGWLKSFADFYHLKDHILEISSMPGYGAKSARSIVNGIEKSRKTTGERFVYSLSIPLCGVDVARKLLSNYSFSDLISRLLSGSARRTDFSKIDGIGDEKSYALIKWFTNPDNNIAVRNLLTEVTVEEPEKSASSNKCDGLTFCVTGSVHHYSNRNELKAYIENSGGKVTGSVSKKTDYLINNDSESTSSKNMKAYELNIPIITENEFIERFGNED